ncbi:protocatechuate 3,4-dioxygenase [Mycobacterium vicinigordonae]|uniref:Protocatechuate 3,4-dioxygenase n=1 Tax=Mycobacterium vicinigordonae TaxID=1719132 RepID=A0A7D6HYI8_9MYCO|nr:protocatechuate 3,4-dioxygenase [Mycobacterium vicinigordonae]
MNSQAHVVLEGFAQLRRSIRALKPDLVILVSSEHGPTLPPSGPQPPFAIAVTDSFWTYGEMHIPRREVPSNRDFAGEFIRYAGGEGFDIASIGNFRADHGIAIPALMMLPELDVAVVPLIVGTQSSYSRAAPTRCYQLGRVLARYAASRDQRVIIVGCGGLSHWPGSSQMGRINLDFDREFLALMSAGDAGYAASWSNDHIVEHAGNGGLEIRNWLVAAAAVGDPGGEILYYEPIRPWVTGMGAFAFTSPAHAD